MTDPLGVPDGFFGPVREEFYGLVGRVTMLAALVDLQQLYLLWTLDYKTPQDVHAGENAAQLNKRCLKLIDDFDDLRDTGTELLKRTAVALDKRNAVVHGLWIEPTTNDAKSWRPAPKSKRVTDDDLVVWHYTRDVPFPALITELVQLVADLGRFRDRANAAVTRRRAGI